MGRIIAGDIIINEIMYHASDSDLEFVELYNNGATTIDLTGWYLIDNDDSHTKCILAGALKSGAYLVVARLVYQFQVAYPTVSNVYTVGFGAGADAWALGNGGDAVRLFDAHGILQDIVIYDDENGWPTAADGKGASLELINPSYDNSLTTSWRSSQITGGTPGQINSVYTTNAAPVCKNGLRLIDLPTHSDNVPVTVFAYDLEDLAAVKLMYSTGDAFTAVTMHDDGLNGDAMAGDSFYTAIIPPMNSGTIVKYYCLAQDLNGQTNTWPNDAPSKFRAYTVDYQPPKLMITEIMAANTKTIADEYGEYDDWLEIYNNDAKALNLKGMYLSSSLNNSMAFELPDLTLDVGQYLLVWADNDPEQGSLHADFKLSASGEAVALWETNEHGNVLIHGWTFPKLGSDMAAGFPSTTSTAPELFKIASPRTANSDNGLFSDICINEFFCTSTAGGIDDWVECYNRGTHAVDISGWFISDNLDNLAKWSFPSGTVIPPGGFIVVDEVTLGFSFSSSGSEVIVLTAADSSTVMDYYDYGLQMVNRSHGRYPDGASNWCFFYAPTKGERNATTALIPPQPVSQNLVLYPNYPNPFNSRTVISFYLPNPDYIHLGVFDQLGREVAVIADERLAAGHHSFNWRSEQLPAGVYFCTLRVGGRTKIHKMILLK
jgi:hypothetical protein